MKRGGFQDRDILVKTVPDSASGPQGYKPLVNWNNVGKGSRQNRSVSSVQRLALKIVIRWLYYKVDRLDVCEAGDGKEWFCYKFLEPVKLLLVYGVVYAGGYWCANDLRTPHRLSIN